MATIIMRHSIADYLNTAESGSASYSLMGVGFHTLDENPAAQTDEKTYIHEKSQTISVKGYQTVFPFDTDLVADEDAVMSLYEVGRGHKTGADAERDYVRVELFRPVDGAENTFYARRFTVAVQVESISGGGGETVKVTGNLAGVGDFTDGTFNTQTKTFTAL